MKNYLLSTLFLFIGLANLQAQVTTSSLTGLVKDSKGEALAGASIRVVHEPTGTVYGSSANAAGRFNISNMRVGGPYTVAITFIGFETKTINDIYLQLGQPYNLNTILKEAGNQLAEVVVTGNNALNQRKTGPATVITNQQIQALPTVSRRINDFTRLTPQADIKGTSLSIGGMNYRFNQLTIDGAVSNDVFGLSEGGTNGSSTGTGPISLDAIEQLTVQVAPFDVRLGGFAGGGISAVTRSGTNDVQGSVYYFTRNQDLTGKTPGALRSNTTPAARLAEFKEDQYGVRVGGPIIKNKLFFFLNAEKTKNTTPLGLQPGQPGSLISPNDLQRINARAIALGYDAGSFLDQETYNESDKIFARFDYNINDNHRLTARYSYVEGSATDLIRNGTTLTFSNGAILRESKTNSGVVELNSRFSNNLSNNFIFGYTSVREPRTAPGAAFPRATLIIGGNTVNLGTEPFSTVNQLNQDVMTLTDNLTLLKQNHTITFGTHNEFYKMYNGFIGSAFGNYTFRATTDINPATGAPYTAVENFERGLASNFQYNYSNTSDPKQGAKFNAMQLGFYVQDEFQVYENLKITGGIRLDVPIYQDEPLENADFNNSRLALQYDVRTNRMPKAAFMWSPRVGFNWDVNNDRSTQVRGGIGIFTSRFPFVWSAGAYTQSGTLLGGNQLNSPQGAATIEFIPDVNNQPKSNATFAPSGNITVLNENLKLPQIARTSLGIDQKLPWGIIGTAEFMYSKNISSFRFRDINAAAPIGQLQGADNRVLYPSGNARRVLPNYTQIVYIDNVNEGYAWSATAQLQKRFENGLFGTVAYTFTESKDLFPGTSSQNQSNFYRVSNVNGPNFAQIGYSPYSTGSRIMAAVSYTKEYIKHLSTTVSLFYNGQSGPRFSYLIQGDPNFSSSGSASDQYSLMYIPRDASEMTFVTNGTVTPEAQWQQFDAFIESQPYLRERRGQYAERNGARTPFTHQFDLRILQNVFTNVAGKRNNIQLSLDVLNVGNLINKDWGQQYTFGSSFWDNSFKPVTFDSFAPGTTTPRYKLNNLNNNEPYFVNDIFSRWTAQVGVRYIFN
ncbi:TonB-dependent receptor [Desertivirga brevis]|uniref:TonB-dependent receptor n=1 Tax=Desertivirga brevis TaxID=2810310 RepID=UPI001A95BB9C|nr:carboxypeptidase regulatory-like domain-containing protein [Pedobacter sp. SYSU D00873]